MTTDIDQFTQHKFIILEGADGTGKTTFCNILMKYINEYYPNTKIMDDNLIRASPLAKWVHDIREAQYSKKNENYITQQALQSLHISIQIDNFYKYLLPAFKRKMVVIFDRSWLSTYVYCIYRGCSEAESKIIVEPIYKLWELYKKYVPTPTVVLFEKTSSFKPDELEHNSFINISNLYRDCITNKFNQKYRFLVHKNDCDLPESWRDFSNLIQIPYVDLNRFLNL